MACAVRLAVKEANCQHIMAFSLSVCRALQEWFEADDLRRITFVYIPSALQWDIHGEAHKYVTELKVRVGRRKTDNSIDALRSRAAHSVLDSWSSTFQDPTYRGSEFLELQLATRPLERITVTSRSTSLTAALAGLLCSPVSIFSFAVAIATPCITPAFLGILHLL
ncbi:unnamed protein product [Cyclocybe aegerita]|uniref:Uncharacterized protein n=1 Tax=Cyclocybe aegerita TaxID=1973307 RepID=A0A8S0XZR9_CYCAE|nr:unnamed protein product [Cyclocybe aegerita]